MEKEFVPYELALRLKALGFDEPCMGCYVEGSEKMMFTHRPVNSNNIAYVRTWRNSDKDDVWSAPTFSQAFRWFREKYDYIGFIYQPNETGYWAYSLEDKAKYDTYEEAELACLDKLIEIVEQTERIEHGVYR